MSLVDRLDVVGCSTISPEKAEKYWREHKSHMTWGVQEALNHSWYPKDIAVLGAGRCNDINLLEIMQRGSVETVDLYDLDATGMDEALHHTRAKISALLPEALDYAQFNPIMCDVTFVLEDILKRFDSLYSRLLHSGVEKDFVAAQTMIVTKIIEEIRDAVSHRPAPDKQYDVVVSDCILSQIVVTLELQIIKFFDALFNGKNISHELWDTIKHSIDTLFVEDHFRVLTEMVKPHGSLFIASDNTLLMRGKVSQQYVEESKKFHVQGSVLDVGEDYMLQEIEIPRFNYLNGDLREMIDKHLPGYTILDEKQWEWNRNPHQLQNNDTIFSAERVQGVVLKNLSQK